MPNKDRPQVERHPPKKGVGWLLNDSLDIIEALLSAIEAEEANPVE